MKALVLAGGRGRRIEPHSAEQNKCMLPLGGQPLIQYSLDNAVRIAPEEIVVVVGYLAEQIVDHYGDAYKGVTLSYSVQHERRGLVHALETAAPSLGGSDFMLFLADEILLDPNHAGMLDAFRASGAFGLCGVTVPSDPEAVRNTYAVLEDQRGRILRLVEKPRHSLNAFQGTGNIVFKHQILEYIGQTPLNQKRNEKELPDLVQTAIDDGHVVKSFLIGGRYININTADDLAAAERALSTAPTE